MKKINVCFLSDDHLKILNDHGVYLDEQDFLGVCAYIIEDLDLLKKSIRKMIV